MTCIFTKSIPSMEVSMSCEPMDVFVSQKRKKTERKKKEKETKKDDMTLVMALSISRGHRS
jgi:hypothetical protein